MTGKGLDRPWSTAGLLLLKRPSLCDSSVQSGHMFIHF